MKVSIRHVLSCALGFAACAGCDRQDASSHDAASAGDDAPRSDAATVGTTGCGAAGVATGLRDATTTVDSVARHYQVFVPDGYDARTPTRLVFVFHGLGGDGAQIRGYLGFEADAAGQAIFVYPDGLPVDGGTGWATTDLAFFDAMVAELSSTYCVDRTRVFAAGHSYGAYMANLVGCERGGVVTAIAAVSGGMVPGDCDAPVAAWIAHGASDTTVPQSEGTAARDRWLAVNGCSTTSQPTVPSPCVAYDGCSAGHAVTWCSFEGGHFPLPAFTRPAIWAFFAPLSR